MGYVIEFRDMNVIADFEGGVSVASPSACAYLTHPPFGNKPYAICIIYFFIFGFKVCDFFYK